MGMLKVVASDIEELVLSGYSDEYIQRSVGIESNKIQYIIDFFRNQSKINMNGNSSKGDKDGHSYRFRNN